MSGRGSLARAVDCASRGDHEGARRLAGRAVDELRRTNPGGTALAQALIVLAHAHQELADYRTPAQLLGEALALARKRPRSEEASRLAVTALEGLGNLQRINGRYPDAERLLREALARAEGRLGLDDPQVAGVLNALAITFKYWGRFDEASELYQRALAITQRALGSEHADVASLLHSIGGLAHARGDYQAAEGSARRAAEIRERALGPDHHDVAADRAALAAILDALGRRDEA